MKNYDTSFSPANRKQVVEVTLQSGEYKGTFKLKPIGGNCLGYEILTSQYFDDEDFVEQISENNISLETIEDSEGDIWIEFILEKEDGSKCQFSDEIRNFGERIVKLEIVECEVDTF